MEGQIKRRNNTDKWVNRQTNMIGMDGRLIGRDQNRYSEINRWID